jgi:hypothetical protein
MVHCRFLFLFELGPLSSSADKIEHCQLLFLFELGPVSSSADKMAYCQLLFLFGLGPVSSSTDKMAHCHLLFLFGLGPVSSTADKMALCQPLLHLFCLWLVNPTFSIQCCRIFVFALCRNRNVAVSNSRYSQRRTDNAWTAEPPSDLEQFVETDSWIDKLLHTCALFRSILISTCPPRPLSVLSRGEGTPRKRPTATEAQFPRIHIRLSWIRGAEWSSAIEETATQLAEGWETQFTGNWASQSSHSCVAE